MATRLLMATTPVNPPSFAQRHARPQTRETVSESATQPITRIAPFLCSSLTRANRSPKLAKSARERSNHG